MKRIILAVVIGWVFGVGVYAAYAESKVIATPKVQVAGKTGDADASIGPVYFPDFYKSKGEQKCRDYLSSLSNKKMLEYVNVRGFKDVDSVRHERKGSKEKCCMKDDLGSCADIVSCGKGDARGIDVQSDIGSLAVGDDDYYDLEGLSGEIEISPGYEKSSKVLFTGP